MCHAACWPELYRSTVRCSWQAVVSGTWFADKCMHRTPGSGAWRAHVSGYVHERRLQGQVVRGCIVVALALLESGDCYQPFLMTVGDARARGAARMALC